MTASRRFLVVLVNYYVFEVLRPSASWFGSANQRVSRLHPTNRSLLLMSALLDLDAVTCIFFFLTSFLPRHAVLANSSPPAVPYRERSFPTTLLEGLEPTPKVVFASVRPCARTPDAHFLSFHFVSTIFPSHFSTLLFRHGQCAKGCACRPRQGQTIRSGLLRKHWQSKIHCRAHGGPV
jgi:hypothetical protein